MRMSKLFFRTLRDTPTEAGTTGHQFLLRAGLLRPLGFGSYSFLPLGTHTRDKVETIARQAMQAVGGQEVDLPYVQSAELIDGGLDLEKHAATPAGPAVRFRDRTQREVVLCTSQEAAILNMARSVVQSYRQLPLMVYQVWQPFRDERRTWGGLFGTREMLVVD